MPFKAVLMVGELVLVQDLRAVDDDLAARGNGLAASRVVGVVGGLAEGDGVEQAPSIVDTDVGCAVHTVRGHAAHVGEQRCVAGNGRALLNGKQAVGEVAVEVARLRLHGLGGVTVAGLFGPGALRLQVARQGVKAGLRGAPWRGAEAVTAGLERADVPGHIGKDLAGGVQLPVRAELRQEGLAGCQLALGIACRRSRGRKIQALVKARQLPIDRGLYGFETGGGTELVRKVIGVLDMQLVHVLGKGVGPLRVEGVRGEVIQRVAR